MRPLLLFALLALPTPPVAPPPGSVPQAPHNLSAWRFLRVITPAANGPAAQQCVLLDADLYARAAAGLRDVRLVQDGRELAFATDESFDDRAGTPATPDRALYEVSLRIAAHPLLLAGVAGSGPGTAASDHLPAAFFGQDFLPAHVPVERVRLDPAPMGTEFLSLRAAEENDPKSAEELDTTLTAAHPAAAFTVGANLQHEANIHVGVHGNAATVESIVLEMRRRQMCYQPRSTAPLLVFLGNESARPVHYDFAAHYQPTGTPLLARMGPAVPNPAYRPRDVQHFSISRAQRLLLALAVSIAMFLMLAIPVLRRR